LIHIINNIYDDYDYRELVRNELYVLLTANLSSDIYDTIMSRLHKTLSMALEHEETIINSSDKPEFIIDKVNYMYLDLIRWYFDRFELANNYHDAIIYLMIESQRHHHKYINPHTEIDVSGIAIQYLYDLLSYSEMLIEGEGDKFECSLDYTIISDMSLHKENIEKKLADPEKSLNMKVITEMKQNLIPYLKPQYNLSFEIIDIICEIATILDIHCNDIIKIIVGEFLKYYEESDSKPDSDFNDSDDSDW